MPLVRRGCGCACATLSGPHKSKGHGVSSAAANVVGSQEGARLFCSLDRPGLDRIMRVASSPTGASPSAVADARLKVISIPLGGADGQDDQDVRCPAEPVAAIVCPRS